MNEKAQQRLLSRFERLWMDPSRARTPWKVVQQRYSEPHRCFHTLRHVSECLAVVDAYARVVGWPEVPSELEFALWFHDVVYEPGASDNEERSADLFESLAAEGGLEAEVIQGACALILETKDHDARGVLLSSIMCDSDLWILGSPPERYQEYTRQVRHEFRRYSELEFRWGRLRFLRGLLRRGYVFTNPLFEEAFGARARRNIQAEVRALSAGRWTSLAPERICWGGSKLC